MPSKAVSQRSYKKTNDAHIIFLVPVHDDWPAFYLLVKQLDIELTNTDLVIDILAVDDGSQSSFQEMNFSLAKLENIKNVSILELRRNLGHQRAIALGLTHVEQNIRCSAVLVMDGDGEDTPSEAKRLIKKCFDNGSSKIIFARRTKRSEGMFFVFCYGGFKILYKLLTGKSYRFGNFSIVPSKFLGRLAIISEGWNHYAASVLKARVPYEEIDTTRGVRLSGKSGMNLTALIIHGLSAISVYSDIAGVRLLVATLISTILSIFLIGIVIFIRLFTTLAIPGWASYATAFLIIILLQCLILSLFFSFIVLSGRGNATFIPQRDYKYFIADTYSIYSSSVKTDTNDLDLEI